MDGVREILNEVIWRARATIAIWLFLLLTYGLQLTIAWSLSSDAADQVIQTHVRTNAGLFFVLSPLLHASHDHFFGNLSLLIPSGVLTEQVVSRRYFIAFVYSAGVLTNFLPPFLGLGGFGVGISGAFYGLWTFVGITYLVQALRPGPKRWVVPYLLVSIFGLFLAFMGVLEWAGYRSAAPGTAKGAHLLGIVFGFGWAIGRAFFSRMRWEVPFANGS